MSQFFTYECVFCDDEVVFFFARDEYEPAVCNLCLDYNEAMEIEKMYENNAYDILADR